mgnify:CR=1 FL=1
MYREVIQYGKSTIVNIHKTDMSNEEEFKKEFNKLLAQHIAFKESDYVGIRKTN